MTLTTRFKPARWLRGIATGVVLGLAVSSVSALTIVRNFIAEGGAFPTAGTGTAAPAVSGGGGNLINIFNLAADWWEAAIQDTHTLTLAYGWGTGLGGGTLGAHNYIAGAAGKQTQGQIRFNNSFNWFLDADPLDNSEFSGYTDVAMDLGGTDGPMNIGRGFSTALGDAAGRFDLFSVALHEIGHALGLSSANPAFQAAVGPNTVADRELLLTTTPLHAGAIIPIEGGSAHIAIPEALMWPFTTQGRRTLISDADILANCQISQFRQCVLDPQFGEIPTPGTLALVGISLVGLGWISRRQRRLR
jgi:hypothetical protein